MDTRTHIVHIIPTLRYGGAERVVVDLVNQMDKKKYRFTIVLFSHDHPLQSELTTGDIIIVQKKGKLSLSFIGDLTRTLRRLKPDLVHTHLFGADVWGRLAARRLHIPIITTEHNINKEEGMIKHLAKRWLRKSSARYIAISDAVAGYMRYAYGVSSQETTVIHNGISIKQFAKLPAPAWKHPLRFLIIGRLTKQKGHRIALHALAKMKQFDWKLTILGDGEEQRNIERLIRRFHLQDRVTMLPSTKNTVAVYAAHDIVIVPSLWEGLGLVVMEAMAAGRLVIAAKTGGIPELIHHTQTGVLFDAGDVSSLRTEMGWCMHSLDHVASIAAAGRAYAAHEFDVSHMVQSYEKMYHDVLKKI